MTTLNIFQIKRKFEQLFLSFVPIKLMCQVQLYPLKPSVSNLTLL